MVDRCFRPTYEVRQSCNFSGLSELLYVIYAFRACTWAKQVEMLFICSDFLEFSVIIKRIYYIRVCLSVPSLLCLLTIGLFSISSALAAWGKQHSPKHWLLFMFWPGPIDPRHPSVKKLELFVRLNLDGRVNEHRPVGEGLVFVHWANTKTLGNGVEAVLAHIHFHGPAEHCPPNGWRGGLLVALLPVPRRRADFFLKHPASQSGRRQDILQPNSIWDLPF